MKLQVDFFFFNFITSAVDNNIIVENIELIEEVLLDKTSKPSLTNHISAFPSP